MNRRCSFSHGPIQIAAALACGMLAACAVDATPETAPAIDGPVVAQLARAREALAASGLSIQLIGYTPATALDTEDAVGLARAQLVDDTAMVPQYDGMNAASLTLSTIHDRTRAFRAGHDAQDVVGNIQAMVFPRIQVGQKALDVTWESQGRRFQSLLVYDDNGVVYDNLLSNIAVVQANPVVQESPPSRLGAAKVDGLVALANQSLSKRFIDLTITWIWGGTRGQIQLDHYVISCDNWVSFCDDGGQSNAWMSLGTAGGDTQRNALLPPRISKLAWAYGWATPTASFSISFNADSLTFSASTSGLGSAGKGSGIDTIF
ncbi:MAG TPA: hypothetical protein VFT22_26500 [Kofleriaceae bacterium]|nr:hypothetical protein [Kofleriaceae bacterium]